MSGISKIAGVKVRKEIFAGMALSAGFMVEDKYNRARRMMFMMLKTKMDRGMNGERMKKIMKSFNFLLTLFVVAMLGCTTIGSKPNNATETPGFFFEEHSNGLPSTGQWRHGLDFYDMNRDGYMDIAAPPPRKAAEGDGRPTIWYGSQNGEWSKFQPEVPSDINYDYGSICIGDFDGDGIPDMALAMHGKGVKVLKSQKNGQYVQLSDGLPLESQLMSRGLVCADFNNDGISDIAAVSEAKFGDDFPAPSGVWACFLSGNQWKCDGIGDKIESLGLYADQLVGGDVNGDGNRDIAVASLVHVRDLIIWLGDGQGKFAPFNNGLPQEVHYLSVDLADINKDGRDDLVANISGIGRTAFKGLKAYLSLSNGFVEISEGLPTDELFTSVRAGDLNNDGRMEVVAATGEGGLKIFTWQNSRWLPTCVSGLPEKGLPRIYNLYLVDLNADGYKDIALNGAVDQNNSGGIRVFLNLPSSRKERL